MGDFNINMLNTEESTSRRLQSVMNDLGLKQMVDQPTHLHPTPTAARPRHNQPDGGPGHVPSPP